MRRYYSYLARSEEKKNIKKAYFFLILTAGFIILVIVFGISSLAKYAGFLGNIKKSGQPVEVTDITPPVIPRLDPIPEATNKKEVEIKGTTEPGATVRLYLNNSEKELTANNSGEFTFTVGLKDGENTVSLIAIDDAGNESPKTNVVKINYDTKAPDLEIIKPQDQAQFYTSKQRQVVIEGKTEPGSDVRINDRFVVVESSGSFTFATTLSEGSNTFTIKASDKAGNTTEKTITVSFSS